MTVLPILAQLLVMFVACLWSQVVLGIRDYRVAATTCYYASPLLWPAAIVLMLSVIVGTSRDAMFWQRPAVVINAYVLSFEEVQMIVSTLLFILALGFWWLRLARAVRRSFRKCVRMNRQDAKNEFLFLCLGVLAVVYSFSFCRWEPRYLRELNSSPPRQPLWVVCESVWSAAAVTPLWLEDAWFAILR